MVRVTIQVQIHKTNKIILLTVLAQVKTLPFNFLLHNKALHPIPLIKNIRMSKHRSCFHSLSTDIKYFEQLTIDYFHMDDLDNLRTIEILIDCCHYLIICNSISYFNSDVADKLQYSFHILRYFLKPLISVLSSLQ